jgi:CBS-domain-containing membrane protein
MSVNDIFCNYGQRLLKRLNNDRYKEDGPVESYTFILHSLIGSFIGILVLSYIDYEVFMEKSDFVMIVGSFGAQAVLIFSAPTAKFSQPWNCIFGNAISSFVGVSMYKFFNAVSNNFDDVIWIASACAVSIAIAFMLLTKSLHPPAGATALIAVQGSKRIHQLGYMYMLFPAVIGSIMFVVIGYITNNISSELKRTYPVVWVPYNIQMEDTNEIAIENELGPKKSSSESSSNESIPVDVVANSDNVTANEDKGNAIELVSAEL